MAKADDEAKDALLEKIRALLGDEAVSVAKQHLETSAQLEKAKAELIQVEQKKQTTASEAEGQVSGLQTRLAEVEKREAGLTAREDAVAKGEVTQEQTGKNLGLREAALIPQEADVRARMLDLSTKETEIVKDATELSQLRNDLLTNAKEQQTKAEELAAKEISLNELKAQLKTIQTELLKREAELKAK